MADLKSTTWRSTCCNPFQVRGHTARKNTLRPVAKWMCEKNPIIQKGSKICDTCRKKLAKVCKDSDLDVDAGTDSSSSTPSESPGDRDMGNEHFESIGVVNKCLVDLGETPVTKRKLQSKKYKERKLELLTTKMSEAMSMGRSRENDEGEILQQLKEKFQSTSQNSERVQILTVLPKSWSIHKIQAEFGVSNFMARKVKQLVKEKGVLSSPDPRPGRHVSKETSDNVVKFYENDEHSRCMPGKKDFVSVQSASGRMHIQKRLILCNLKELYQHFKTKYPQQHIGFSKFAELRPKHCILAGASGTHSVCVCTIHQNVKLMLLGARVHELNFADHFLSTYHHFIAKIICNPPLPDCYLGECKVCPGVEPLKHELYLIFDENMIDSVTYKQWTAVDRSTLETVSQQSYDFVESFCERLEALRSHSFIASQQSRFFDESKSSLKPQEVVVCADFSENYAFVLQDAAQGFHWNNAQATLHPFVIYYRESVATEVRHLNFVVISNCMNHDTVAVHLFQKKLILFLKRALSFFPVKVIYFSDGAASQYKNRKNFVNLCNHQADFGVSAEWHFSATSHGKGACDGLGGTVKRLATKASLQRPYKEQIMTPLQLFQWASASICGVTFDYVSVEEYESEKQNLETRFDSCRTIPGTRRLHCFIPQSQDTLVTKRYSASSSSQVQRVSKSLTDLEMEQVTEYVTCKCGSQWWLAQVLDKDKENCELQLSLLYPNGPSRWYSYPQTPVILCAPMNDILTVVEPRTTTGRSYTLTQNESKAATRKLKCALTS